MHRRVQFNVLGKRGEGLSPHQGWKLIAVSWLTAAAAFEKEHAWQTHHFLVGMLDKADYACPHQEVLILWRVLLSGRIL